MSELESLFPRCRRELLALMFLNPRESFNVRAIARKLGTGHGAVQREIGHLLAAKLLTARREGRKILYQINPDCFIAPELQRLVEKTAGPTGRVREALLPLSDRMVVAFIYGSIASRSARPTSDVDLLVLGTVNFGEICGVLSAAEEALGREINATIYPPEEFRAKLRQGNPFLSSILSGPMDFVIGTARDLERLV